MNENNNKLTELEKYATWKLKQDLKRANDLINRLYQSDIQLHHAKMIREYHIIIGFNPHTHNINRLE